MFAHFAANPNSPCVLFDPLNWLCETPQTLRFKGKWPNLMQHKTQEKRQKDQWLHSHASAECTKRCDFYEIEIAIRSVLEEPKVSYPQNPRDLWTRTFRRQRSWFFLRFVAKCKRPHCGLAGDEDVCNTKSRRCGSFGALRSFGFEMSGGLMTGISLTRPRNGTGALRVLFFCFVQPREDLNGVGAEGVGVKYPIFPVNCSRLHLY